MTSSAATGVFGYGSLMNAATHDYPGLRPARLEGWRRLWCHTAARTAAYLTAEPAPGTAIEGAVADVPTDAWPALDRREGAYGRHEVELAMSRAGGAVVVYAVPVEERMPATARHPVLLSYLDVVIQGAMALHGEGGAAGVLRHDLGLGRRARRSRGARYARAQRLTAAERAAVDEGLARLGVERVRSQAS